jgi:alanine racemase
VEVDSEAIRHNVGQVRRLTGDRPILAVVKNNAYGLDLAVASPVLESLPQIAGFAVVKAEAGIQLREIGVRKPILLMGMASEEEARELVARKVALSLYTDAAPLRLDALRRSSEGPIAVQFYLDTGMGRMGMGFRRALPWMQAIAARNDVRIEGTFTALTEDASFDAEQTKRFLKITRRATELGVSTGRLHVAASNAVYHLPDSHLDMVRPGIALYGSYPSRPHEEKEKGELRPSVRLRCRVVRVERLERGDGVSYGRNYIAQRPTWVATLPVGHADGYPRGAVNGARVLIGGRLHPVVGAVSASHTIVEIGEERSVDVGEVATLVGPDHPEIHPNAVAQIVGISVYDILMHLNPALPRIRL